MLKYILPVVHTHRKRYPLASEGQTTTLPKSKLTLQNSHNGLCPIQGVDFTCYNSYSNYSYVNKLVA